MHTIASSSYQCARQTCLQNGMLLLTAGMYETLRFIPPLVVTEAEIDEGTVTIVVIVIVVIVVMVNTVTVNISRQRSMRVPATAIVPTCVTHGC